MYDRNIFLFGCIDCEKAEDKCSEILSVPYHKTKPIKLYLNCYGGNLDDSMAIINAMNLTKNKIHTIILGEALSAGALISISGDKRYCCKYSSFMFHKGIIDTGREKSLEDNLARLKHFKDLDTIVYNLFREKTKLTNKEINSIMLSETWYYPEEMKSKGIIDRILK